MGRLSGKVALITGAASGIGREAAILFAQEGAHVIVADIDIDAAEQTAADASNAGRGHGGEAIAAKCDVTDKSSVEAAVHAAILRFGCLNVLYNNAGGSSAEDGPVTEAPEAEFWRAIKLDLFGTFLCSKVIIPELIRSGGGCVINATSIVALKGLPGHDCYTAAKGGVAALTRSMATEFARHGVRVNAVAPGVTLTTRVQQRLATTGALDSLASKQLLGMVQPKEIAEMALFLASDASLRITGQVFSVDGGASIV
ncbi:MAG: SDR family oxidoreductase [Pseudomonadota bacterium]